MSDLSSADGVPPVTVRFRFYKELNDLLAPHQRYQAFDARCARDATVKHMIEALGVPHTEVELVLVNGESCGFARLLRDGDRVSVYPRFETFDISPLLRVRAHPLRDTRFIADAHLGGLARLLRLTGFDTLYDNHYADDEIVAIATREHRIVLTRDRELLKRRSITHGCYVHALKPPQQAAELFQRLDLARSARPFTRCLQCNATLHPIDKALIAHRLPPHVREHQQRFSSCEGCQRIFWEGSHWQRMRRRVAELLSAAADASAGPDSGQPR
ncbi:Mut7-C RNAse domain-containing protein [Thauera sp.]|uniref:Mut7-C RNAse domain-containing protein n=1 Tax=Thauera sp. TaxID=1905334 RepID=UPI002BD055B5|nr:Mut7-C RNAse domain-containing protein [Thauera sp.]HRP24882.1 Mut7-C RNAse domain-containing protein [Thauera sp.]